MVKVNWGFLLLLACSSEGSSELLGKSASLELKRPCLGIDDKKQAPTQNAKGHSIPPLMRTAELKEFGDPSQQKKECHSVNDSKTSGLLEEGPMSFPKNGRNQVE
jgi:hypothetical protein